MNYAFDTRVVLLISCLLQGFTALRLLKVSIPAYKLRGESAFLECQYELNRSHSGVHSSHGGGYRNQQQHHGGGSADNDMNYVDVDSTGDDHHVYRRMRTHQQQQHQQQAGDQQQQPPPLRQYHYQQPRHVYYQQPQALAYQAYESQSHHQQYQQQHQQQPQPQQPPYYQTQPSPYGHSVYRGSSQLGLYSSNNNGAGGGGGSSAGHVGASTYTGGSASSSYMTNVDIGHDDDSFGDSSEDEHQEEDGEALYAIKWYKDNEEFYRYVPKAKPPKTSYRVDGVRVIEEHSDSARVLLRGLTLNSTGMYRCEISAEAPNFSSVQGEGRMDIVYLPRDGPHIKGQQFQYQIGEILNLNCTSGKSHPASHLQWFINEQPVIDDRYLFKYNDTVHKHGLITSTLGLQLTVDGRHFREGAMRVKCLASISPVLWKGGKESVLQRRPGIIDNREAMLLVRSLSTSLLQHESNLLRSLTIMIILARCCQLLLRTELT